MRGSASQASILAVFWGTFSHTRLPAASCFPFIFMASEITSSESAQDALRNSGFYCEKNPLVGGEILRMEREDFTLMSKDGLEFYEVNILNNKVRSSLGSLPALAYIPRFSSARAICSRFHASGLRLNTMRTFSQR